MSGTRSQKEQALTHLMRNVLELDDTTGLDKALAYYGYKTITDITAMDKEEIMELVYMSSDTTPVEKHVIMAEKKKLLHAVWWFDHQTASRTVPTVEVSEFPVWNLSNCTVFP